MHRNSINHRTFPCQNFTPKLTAQLLDDGNILPGNFKSFSYSPQNRSNCCLLSLVWQRGCCTPHPTLKVFGTACDRDTDIQEQFSPPRKLQLKKRNSALGARELTIPAEPKIRPPANMTVRGEKRLLRALPMGPETKEKKCSKLLGTLVWIKQKNPVLLLCLFP